MNAILSLPFSLETAVEHQIAADPEWQRGVVWGKPRPGHPEGLVLHHIADVLQNIDNLFGSDPNREQLRQIALLHDSFKRQARERTPKQPHGLVARQFAEKYIEETAVLLVIQRHDDAYKAYRSLYCNEVKAIQQAKTLIVHLGIHIDLFMAFYWCDNCVAGKIADHYHWFQQLINSAE